MAKPPIDPSVRTALVAKLNGQWRETGAGFAQGDLADRLASLGEAHLKADLAYLTAQEAVETGDGSVRLSPACVDLREKHFAG